MHDLLVPDDAGGRLGESEVESMAHRAFDLLGDPIGAASGKSDQLNRSDSADHVNDDGRSRKQLPSHLQPRWIEEDSARRADTLGPDVVDADC